MLQKLSVGAADNDGTGTPLKSAGQILNAALDQINGLFPDGSSGDFSFAQLAVESGYAWGLCDQNGRAALLVKRDGTVVIPKQTITLTDGSVALAKLDPTTQGLIPAALSADSGYLWALVDSLNRIGLGVKTDGTIVGKITAPPPAGVQYLQPTTNLWCLGDSLTAGAGGQLTWRERLATNFPTRTITNWGWGGQTSTQIAARAGAYVSLLTVSGNTIPASGAVTVTALSVLLLSSAANLSGTSSYQGWLGGIYGTLTCTHDTGGVITNDTYTFTRATAGSATYCAPNSPFVPDVSSHDFDTFIVFLGRNNLTLPSDIERDIGLCVGFQKTAEKRFLVITPPNGGPLTSGQSTTEGTGSSTLTNIKAIESWAVQTYGDRVLKVREFSFQYNNGSADDLDDVAKETVPRSLRIDGVHWTTTFHGHVADWIANEINRRGW